MLARIDRHRRRRVEQGDRVIAGGRRQHAHAAAFQHAAEREDVARIVVDEEHRLADEILVRAVQLLEHALFFRRQIADHAMQEQRRLVEQALGRFDALDDDAARHRVELRILLGRELAAGEDDDRQIGEILVVAHPLQQVEAGHVRQTQIEDDAVDRLLAQHIERRGAGLDRGDVDIVVAEQLGDAEPLRGIVLDDEQALASRLGIFLDARQRGFQPLGRRRLGDEREGAARQPVLAILVEGDDLHRNVPRLGVLLELAKHRPAQHVGQEDVERDGARPILAGQRQRLGAARRHQDLEAAVMREISHDACVMRVVLDNEEHGIAGFDPFAVVGDVLGRDLGDADGPQHVAVTGGADRRHDALLGGRPDIFERQIEGEDAAAARRGAQLDLAAEQVGKLAADGETESGAAIFPAGAGIGLLERLEDDLLLLERNADAGIGDLEGDHRRRAHQGRMIGAPAAARRGDAEADAALLGELEGVRQKILQHLLQAL